MDYARAKSTEPSPSKDHGLIKSSPEALQALTRKQSVDVPRVLVKAEQGTSEHHDHRMQPSSQAQDEGISRTPQSTEGIPKLSTISQLLHLQEESFQGHLAAHGNKLGADSSKLLELMNRGFSQINGRFDEFEKLKAAPCHSDHSAEMQVKLGDATKARKLAEGKYLEFLPKYENLVQLYNKATSKIAGLEEALQKQYAQRQGSTRSPLANSKKATDSAIQSKWKQLQYNIHNLAFFLAKIEPSGELDEVIHMRMRGITTSYMAFLRNEDYRELILQAYLWVLVHRQVFDGQAGAWAGEDEFHLKTLKDNILLKVGEKECIDTLPRVARWFAQGSVFLDELWIQDDRVITGLIRDETRRLYPFLENSPASQERPRARVWDELQGIVKTALELDRMMMNSKAIFQIYWKDESQKPTRFKRYNMANMEAVCHERELSPQSIVRFFVSPMLYKVGNADGESYDTRMLLEKASVACH
ncbi:Fc.00g063570.m01.CDS01 [Cosmosporella sp. VM-42]